LSATADEIAKRLRERFAPAHLEIVDDSAKHAGHAGAAAGGGHYACVIVAEAFRGRSPIDRHRSVYEALGDLMRRRVHALALTTFDPEEWASRVG